MHQCVSEADYVSQNEIEDDILLVIIPRSLRKISEKQLLYFLSILIGLVAGLAAVALKTDNARGAFGELTAAALAAMRPSAILVNTARGPIVDQKALTAALQASTDALLDPQVLLEAAVDSSGQIVDFLYREVNQATCDYLGLSREELLGRGVVETMPGIKATLLDGYIRCLDTGEPLILNDFSYDNEILRDTRLYDLRVTRAASTSLVLTWRDVTDRYATANALARDIQRYLADEVVEARPPSAAYRLQKFVRRNKGQAIAASLVAAAS